MANRTLQSPKLPCVYNIISIAVMFVMISVAQCSESSAGSHRWQMRVNGLDKKAKKALEPLSRYEFTVPERQLMKGVSYYGSSSRLRKFVADLLSGSRPLRIGAVGGSHSWTSSALTLGLDDWFTIVKNWMASATSAEVTSRNGCIPGTTPGYLVPCVEGHVDAEVDLLFIEYTPNVDTTDRMHDRVAGNVFVKDMEKLLQRLLAWPSRPALVLVNAPHAHLPLTAAAAAASAAAAAAAEAAKTRGEQGGAGGRDDSDLLDRFYNTMEDLEGALTTLLGVPSVSARPLLHHLRAKLLQKFNATGALLAEPVRRMALATARQAAAAGSDADPGSNPSRRRKLSQEAEAGAAAGEADPDAAEGRTRTAGTEADTDASASDTAETTTTTVTTEAASSQRRIALEGGQQQQQQPLTAKTVSSYTDAATEALLRLVETAGGDAALVVHRTLADLLVYLLQSTALDLQYNPISEEERELLARPVPRPMYPDDALPVSTSCLQAAALQAAVSSSAGWSWTNVGLPSSPRFGFASAVPHAKLVIPLGPHVAAHPAARLSVALHYLKSHRGGMGMAGLRCHGGGCFCKAHAVDARMDVALAQSSSAWLTVVPRGVPGVAECDVVVTVLQNTTSGGNNFVITGVGIRVLPERATGAGAAAAIGAAGANASAGGAGTAAVGHHHHHHHSRSLSAAVRLDPEDDSLASVFLPM